LRPERRGKEAGPAARRRKTNTADVVVRASAETGEGPVWDARTGELVWVDIPAGLLHRSDVSSGADTATPVGMKLGAVAVAAAGGWAAAAEDGFGLINADGHLDLQDRALPEPGTRMNDAACDGRGRMWAGSLGPGVAPGTGMLHCWEPGQPSSVVLRGLSLPNGIAWSPGGRQMYLADSTAGVVYEFGFDPDDGRLGGQRVLIEIPPDQGMPDGLCADAEGCLWLAVWGGWQVRRYDPQGRLVAAVDFPVEQPSACAFGPGTTQYVTSAWEGLPAGHGQELAGSVFAFDAGVGGAEVGVFGRQAGHH
jgi:sugar lactone lactonase YvrE